MFIFVHIFLLFFVTLFFISARLTSRPFKVHPRLLILIPIESPYATSCKFVTVTLVLSCTVSEILQIFVLVTSPLCCPNFRGVPVGSDDPCWGHSEQVSLAIQPWNYFRSIPIWPMWSRYPNVTDMDRRTTYCGITALCAASRGKKPFLNIVNRSLHKEMLLRKRPIILTYLQFQMWVCFVTCLFWCSSLTSKKAQISNRALLCKMYLKVRVA